MEGKACVPKMISFGVFLSIIALVMVVKLPNMSRFSKKSLFNNIPAPIPSNYSGAPEKPKAFKTILYWTKWFGINPNWGKGQKSFLDAKCIINNCNITWDKSHLKHSDAVIFHMPDFSKIPTIRLPHQNWVFYTKESPSIYPRDLRKYKNMFNMTITYREDSDVKEPYGKILASAGKTWEGLRNLNSIKTYDPSFKQRKPVAWFVSHCRTIGKRDDYVKELNKYIPVDIYGKCGPKSCHGKASKSCYEMLQENYKFYLSFENSICKDYITEKLFNVFKYNVVPVVFGGANYTNILPPGSFINALDFQSPKKLADHLISIGRDEQKFRTFFDWKSKYYVQYGRVQMYCDLCEYINQPNQYKVYKDIHKWWNIDTCDNEMVPRQMKHW